MRLRSIARRVGLWIAIGAAANVLVAWGLTPYGQRHGTVGVSSSDPPDRIWKHTVPANWPEPDFRIVTLHWYGVGDYAGAFKCSTQNGAEFLGVGESMQSDNYQLSESCDGWPFPSMRCWELLESHILTTRLNGPPSAGASFAHADVGAPVPVETHGRWNVPYITWDFRGRRAVVSVYWCPTWPGFSLNTAFYAALLWGAIRGPRAIRLWHRRRHNRCNHCGYALEGLAHGETGGSVCPECGKPTT